MKRRPPSNFKRTKGKKPLIITKPDGEEIQIESLNNWAWANRLNPQHLRAVANGERKDYKGYKARWINEK